VTVFGALVVALICSFRCSVRYLALYFIVHISDPLWFTWNAHPNPSIRLFVLLYPDFILRIGEKNFTEYDSGEFYEKLTTHSSLPSGQIILITSKCVVWTRTRTLMVKLPPRQMFLIQVLSMWGIS